MSRAQNRLIQAVQTAALSLAPDSRKQVQIAFFGGSFTALPEETQFPLLQKAHALCETYGFDGIRISTRPDCLDAYTLRRLRKYGVKAVELGAQSLADRVLQLNRRGHTAREVEAASALIQAHGLELGLQMMTGLYGDDDPTALATADRIIALRPGTVRIYPTLVLRGTLLHRLYLAGLYRPQTLRETVALGAKLLWKFHQANIPVIRFGLHPEPAMEENVAAGPLHPALRELCENSLYLHLAQHQVEATGSKGPFILRVTPKALSKMIGQQRQNLQKLSRLGYTCTVLADPELPEYTVRAEVSAQGGHPS